MFLLEHATRNPVLPLFLLGFGSWPKFWIPPTGGLSCPLQGATEILIGFLFLTPLLPKLP